MSLQTLGYAPIISHEMSLSAVELSLGVPQRAQIAPRPDEGYRRHIASGTIAYLQQTDFGGSGRFSTTWQSHSRDGVLTTSLQGQISSPYGLEHQDVIEIKQQQTTHL